MLAGRTFKWEVLNTMAFWSEVRASGWMEEAELFHLFGDDVAAAYFDLNGNGRPNSDAPDDLAADPGAVG